MIFICSFKSLLVTQFNLKQWCGATPPSQMALFFNHLLIKRKGISKSENTGTTHRSWLTGHVDTQPPNSFTAMCYNAMWYVVLVAFLRYGELRCSRVTCSVEGEYDMEECSHSTPYTSVVVVLLSSVLLCYDVRVCVQWALGSMRGVVHCSMRQRPDPACCHSVDGELHC